MPFHPVDFIFPSHTYYCEKVKVKAAENLRYDLTYMLVLKYLVPVIPMKIYLQRKKDFKVQDQSWPQHVSKNAKIQGQPQNSQECAYLFIYF